MFDPVDHTKKENDDKTVCSGDIVHCYNCDGDGYVIDRVMIDRTMFTKVYKYMPRICKECKGSKKVIIE